MVAGGGGVSQGEGVGTCVRMRQRLQQNKKVRYNLYGEVNDSNATWGSISFGHGVQPCLTTLEALSSSSNPHHQVESHKKIR